MNRKICTSVQKATDFILIFDGYQKIQVTIDLPLKKKIFFRPLLTDYAR